MLGKKDLGKVSQKRVMNGDMNNKGFQKNLAA